MSYKNTTPNFNLPLYGLGDTFNYLTDHNKEVEIIDQALIYNKNKIEEIEKKLESGPSDDVIGKNEIIEYTHKVSDSYSFTNPDTETEFSYKPYHILYPPTNYTLPDAAPNISFTSTAAYKDAPFIIWPGNTIDESGPYSGKILLRVYYIGSRQQKIDMSLYRNNTFWNKKSYNLGPGRVYIGDKWDITANDFIRYTWDVACSEYSSTLYDTYFIKEAYIYTFIIIEKSNVEISLDEPEDNSPIATIADTSALSTTPWPIIVQPKLINGNNLPENYFTTGARVLGLLDKDNNFWFNNASGSNTTSGGSYVKVAQSTVSPGQSVYFDFKYDENMQIVLLSQSDNSVPLAIGGATPSDNGTLVKFMSLPQIDGVSWPECGVVLMCVIPGE